MQLFISIEAVEHDHHPANVPLPNEIFLMDKFRWKLFPLQTSKNKFVSVNM